MPRHSAAHKAFLPLNNRPDVSSTVVSGNSAGSSTSTTCTTGALHITNPAYLLCLVGTYSLASTLPTCKWNNLAMTQLSSGLEGTYVRAVLFGLQVPAASIGASAAFVATTPSGYNAAVGMFLPGVFTATGVSAGSAGNSGAASITCPSAAGQWVVGGFSAWNNVSSGSGTSSIDSVSNTDSNVLACEKAGAASVTLNGTLTSTFWAGAAASLKRVAA